MFLLTETTDQVESIVEETAKGKKVFIEGVFSTAGKKNRNGRVYSKAVLEKAVDEYNEQWIKTKKSIGETNHPSYPFPDMNNASIMIESLTWQGDDVVGKARVLSNTHGQNIKALIEDGYKVGISSRGTGSIKNVKGINEVQMDYQMFAYDLVSNASNFGSESLDSMIEGYLCEGIWTPGKQEIITTLEEATAADLHEAKVNSLIQILGNLK